MNDSPWEPFNVCAAPFWRYLGAQAIPDGERGAIFGWYDFRKNAQAGDIFAQRIGPSGEPLWMEDGVPVCLAPGEQYNNVLVSDGSGGAILAWSDRRSQSSIYAQRVTRDGSVAWARDGVQITKTEAVTPVMASDGRGGALVVWEDWTGGPRKIRAQRLDSSGELLWGTSGAGICTVRGSHASPKICSDGAGGAFVSWTDQRGPVQKVFVQHVGPLGEAFWADQGIPVCLVASTQFAGALVANSDGGATVIWGDSRSRPPGYFGLYAQRLDASGNGLWTPGGVALSERTASEHLSASTLSDGDDLVVVSHERVGSHFDSFAQRLDPGGNRLLGSNGLVVADGPGDQIYPIATLDQDHGMLVAWTDFQFPPARFTLKVQHIDDAGRRKWGDSGIDAALVGNDAQRAFVTDGRGGAFAGWERPVGPDISIMAARIDVASGPASSPASRSSPRQPARPDDFEAEWSIAESSLRLTLPRESEVSVSILDLAGRLLRELRLGPFGAGARSVPIDMIDAQGRALPSGMYFSRVRTRWGFTTIAIPVLR